MSTLESELFSDIRSLESQLKMKQDDWIKACQEIDALTKEAVEREKTLKIWIQSDKQAREYAITLELKIDLQARQIDTLFDVIAHGDKKHREWLFDAIEKHFKIVVEMENGCGTHSTRDPCNAAIARKALDKDAEYGK